MLAINAYFSNPFCSIQIFNFKALFVHFFDSTKKYLILVNSEQCTYCRELCMLIHLKWTFMTLLLADFVVLQLMLKSMLKWPESCLNFAQVICLKPLEELEASVISRQRVSSVRLISIWMMESVLPNAIL